MRFSWKTTLTGIFMILGAISSIALKFFHGEPIESDELAAAITAIIGGIGLITARDNDKTSEEIGAKVWEHERDREDLNK